MQRKNTAGSRRLSGNGGATGACPCGSRRPYADCCGPLHDGAPAADAAVLMRSRYCAYVVGAGDYLLATWHTDTRPLRVELAPVPRWLGLELRRHLPLGPDAATVEFVARYRVSGRAGRLHEISRFVREDGRWFYVDGEFPRPNERSAVLRGAAGQG